MSDRVERWSPEEKSTLEASLRAILTADDLDHARRIAEGALAQVGLVPRYVHRQAQFTAEQIRRPVKSNVLRGIAALTEMVDLIGKAGATDPDVARVLTTNELELRELRWFAMQQLTAMGQQK